VALLVYVAPIDYGFTEDRLALAVKKHLSPSMLIGRNLWITNAPYKADRIADWLSKEVLPEATRLVVLTITHAFAGFFDRAFWDMLASCGLSATPEPPTRVVDGDKRFADGVAEGFADGIKKGRQECERELREVKDQLDRMKADMNRAIRSPPRQIGSYRRINAIPVRRINHASIDEILARGYAEYTKIASQTREDEEFLQAMFDALPPIPDIPGPTELAVMKSRKRERRKAILDSIPCIEKSTS
jgi:hypothetical protein